MRTAQSKWTTFRQNYAYDVQYYIKIYHQEGSTSFYGDTIDKDSIRYSRAVIPDDLSVGNVCSSVLQFTVYIGDSEIVYPPAAKVEIYVRLYVQGRGGTYYISEGTYYIDHRKKSADGWLTITAYDEVLKSMSAPFVSEGEQEDWPQSMRTVLQTIAQKTGLSLDSRNSTPSSYMVEYPNDLTIREVLSNIAAACGANAMVTPMNKLYVCPLQLSTPVLALTDAEGFELLGEPVTVTRVTCIYNENGDYYTSGTDGYELVVNCLWATQQIADDLWQKLHTLTYVPYTLTDTLDHLIELGDTISYNGTQLYVGSIERDPKNKDLATFSAPIQNAEMHELPYQGVLTRQLGRKATLGTKYYGVSLSRANGLQIDRTDGDGNVDASVVLNSNELSFYQGSVRVLYFDPVSAKYRFLGDIVIQNGSITWDSLSSDVQSAISATPSVTFQKVNAALGQLFKDYNGGAVTTVTGSYIYAPKIKGGEIYGTAIYAGTGSGFAAMTDKGLDVSDSSGNSKIGTGYDTVQDITYPFLKLGIGSDTSSSGAGLVYKLGAGLWVGDSEVVGAGGQYPGNRSSVTDISASYPNATGLFIDFAQDRLYKYINGVPTPIDAAVFS